eukprot:scaffold3690_cov113-Isochrysis_galbana.AAC.6
MQGGAELARPSWHPAADGRQHQLQLRARRRLCAGGARFGGGTGAAERWPVVDCCARELEDVADLVRVEHRAAQPGLGREDGDRIPAGRASSRGRARDHAGVGQREQGNGKGAVEQATSPRRRTPTHGNRQARTRTDTSKQASGANTRRRLPPPPRARGQCYR